MFANRSIPDRFLGLFLVPLLFAPACSSSAGVQPGSGEAGPGLDSGKTADARILPPDSFIAVAPPPEIQIPSHGGSVLAAPKLVTISYASDPNAANMQAFATWFASSSYFTETVGEFGVGAGTYGGAYTFSSSPSGTLTDAQIETDLDSAVGSGAIPAGSQTVFVITIPPGVTVTSGSGTSCVQFLGYHYLTSSGNIYAVIPVCPGSIPGLTDQNVQTIAASHEISEASTDPHLDAYSANGLPFGGEDGDLCADHWLMVSGYTVQREYSNAAAAAGHDPCIPVDPPSTPWAGIGPTTPGAVTIAAGGSMTIDTLAFATSPIAGPIQIGLAPEQGVNVTASASQAIPGQHVTLTISVASGASGYATGFALYGQVTGSYDFSDWPIEVDVP